MKPLPATAGTGFIFDDSLLHGSPNNLSDHARLAVQIACVPSEARPVFYFHPDQTQFEMVDADVDFYIANTVSNLAQRNPGWTSRGFVPDHNRSLDKATFLRLLAGERLPDRNNDVATSPRDAKPGLLTRMSQWVDRVRR